MDPSPAVVEAVGLVKHFDPSLIRYRRHSPVVHAVCDVSFRVERGRTLGLIGESGCGKSTTARLVLGLLTPTAGTVRFRGDDIFEGTTRQRRRRRTGMQLVFQDPYASLDPRLTVGASIAEPLRANHRYRPGGAERVRELLRSVELDPADADRYPHQFSGGQRQRIGIARALALSPELLVLDEPVSSLDVSVQAGVINLLSDLQSRMGLAYLFVAHDLGVTQHVADDVAVMYLGRFVETGPAGHVLARPSHPYTQALVSAVSSVDVEPGATRRRIVLNGEIPSAEQPPTGCRFRTRCWKAERICAEEEPALTERGTGHPVACHFPGSP